jgi:hypothetical protein
MNRSKFIHLSALGGLAIAGLESCSTSNSLTKKFVKDPLKMSLSREFVFWAHSNLKEVKTLTQEHPHIVNATVDWGDGDFESALGAASHVGNKDIANYLMEQGARADIFTLAMLGKEQLVIQQIEAFPKTINLIGPHGFTLLHHAAIGVKSQKLIDYLKNKGLTEKFIETYKK